MQDLYPSRKDSKPFITERKDPVVYSDLESSFGPLSSEQLKFFEKNGFLFLEKFFDESEVSEMRGELSRLCNEFRGSKDPKVIIEPESEEVRSIFAVHDEDRFFNKLSEDPRLVSRLEQLLGSETYIHQSRINLKNGFNGKEFYWHSDFETWHVEDGMPNMRAVSCSITLTDNTVYNGSLMVIPGSHKYFVSCVGETPENHYEQSLRKQEFGVPDPECLKTLYEMGGITMPIGPAGSVLLFDCNLMHGSGSNISPLPRSNVFFVFNSVKNQLVQPFSGQQPRPGFIASRVSETTPV